MLNNYVTLTIYQIYTAFPTFLSLNSLRPQQDRYHSILTAVMKES